MENSLALDEGRSRHRSTLRFAKLLVTILYTTHLAACLWCLVPRLGYWSMSGGKAVSTPFFPDLDVIAPGNALNGYVRAIYWAWANLAGIGNVNSTPTTTMECLVSLAVQMVGATLYAIATGNIVTLLEESASHENEMAEGATALSKFMQTTSVPADARQRIMRGYIMRNVIVQEDEDDDDTDSENDMDGTSQLPDETGRLPVHLLQELHCHALANALKRKDRAFQDCTPDFLFVLMESLKAQASKTLVAGDYLFEQGQQGGIQQLYVVERGMLDVIVDGKSVRTLSRGDVLGLPWFVTAAHEPEAFWFQHDEEDDEEEEKVESEELDVTDHEPSLVDASESSSESKDELLLGLTTHRHATTDDVDLTEQAPKFPPLTRRHTTSVEARPAGQRCRKLQLSSHLKRHSVMTAAGASTNKHLELEPETNQNALSRVLWGDPKGPIRASVRALQPCALVTGVHTFDDIRALKQQFPEDFAKLQAQNTRAEMTFRMIFQVENTGQKMLEKFSKRLSFKKLPVRWQPTSST